MGLEKGCAGRAPVRHVAYRICLHRPRMPPMNSKLRALVGLNLPRTSLTSNGTVYCGDDSLGIGPDY